MGKSASGKKWRSQLHAVFSSGYMQSSLQLGVGMFVACLFTYILPITFPPMSCVVATWLCVVAVMASPANHLGVRVTSAAVVLGSTWVGAVLGATVMTLSHLAGPMFSRENTAVVGVLAPVVIGILAPLRVAARPPLLWAQGMNACLAFGLTSLTTYAQAGVARTWYVAGTLVLANTIAAVAVVLIAALVLPTHATEEVQSTVADVLLLSGVAMSRYAGRLFRPLDKKASAAGAFTAKAAMNAADGVSGPFDQSSQSAAAADDDDDAMTDSQQATGMVPAAVRAASVASVEEAADAAQAAADVVMEQLAAADVDTGTSSSTFDVTVDVETGVHDTPNILGTANPGSAVPVVVKDALTEDEWVQLMARHSTVKAIAPDASSYARPQLPISSLRPRLAKAQGLFLNAAAMEPQWIRGGIKTALGRPGCFWFDVAAWGKTTGSLQILLTRLSALEAVIEDGESLHSSNQPTIKQHLLQHLAFVYSTAATSLAHMAHTVRQQHAAGHSSSKGSVTDKSGYTSVDAVCGRSASSRFSWQEVKAELSSLMHQECEDHWVGVMQAAADHPAILSSLTVVRHIMFTWTLTTAIIDTLSDLEQAVTAAVTATPPSHKTDGTGGVCSSLWAGTKATLVRLFGWLLPTIPWLSGRFQVAHCLKTWGPDLWRNGLSGLRSSARSPVFQAGFKYWLVLSIVFEVLLMHLHFMAVLRPLNPGFGFVAASLSMSEKVEATFSKFVFWAFGTILGGALGFLAMWHVTLALDPYGLTAVVVAVALVVGMLGVTKARVGITLVLMTLSTLILCQCCGHVGVWGLALTRVVSVLFGITTAVAVCNLVMPWYTSTWCIESMQSAYVTATQLFFQMFAQFYADGAAAIAAFEADTPACPYTQPQDAGVPVGGGMYRGADAAAAALAASTHVAKAAGTASAAIAKKGYPACPLKVTPPVLQSLLAQPLIAVQTSLIMDTVMWNRGVLATPAVVPALLRAMFGLLDRMAGMQLTLHPPCITKKFTGTAAVHYGVPMADKVCSLIHLCGKLAAAVTRVLEEPSCDNVRALKQVQSEIQAHRATMFSHMKAVRQQLHIDVHQQHQRLLQLLEQQQELQRQGLKTHSLDSQICPVRRQMTIILGGVDDTVRFMGFQFASIKATNMFVAVADVAATDACRSRNSTACMLK